MNEYSSEAGRDADPGGASAADILQPRRSERFRQSINFSSFIRWNTTISIEAHDHPSTTLELSHRENPSSLGSHTGTRPQSMSSYFSHTLTSNAISPQASAFRQATVEKLTPVYRILSPAKRGETDGIWLAATHRSRSGCCWPDHPCRQLLLANATRFLGVIFAVGGYQTRPTFFSIRRTTPRQCLRVAERVKLPISVAECRYRSESNYQQTTSLIEDFCYRRLSTKYPLPHSRLSTVSSLTYFAAVGFASGREAPRRTSTRRQGSPGRTRNN
ncbi:hypothetical protein BIW11_03208 [Tropilaelaps mercedesae]|uniref:Uncharacterized protein n=1 Tax=Tropilaelaps mercedesae TaxID=418985 RepID=A0A1V9XQD0_9ACAR|nr:hypothetical protein BIW11_03208 [Tropilaelaps mercedesae]